MPTFEIASGPATVDLKRTTAGPAPAPASGSLEFKIVNKSAAPSAGRLSVVPSGASKAEWFTIEGDRERIFATGDPATARVSITVPADASAGDYPFRLRVVAVNDPDNDHAEGPVCTATLPPAPPPPPKRSLWWLWLLIGLLVLGLIAGGVWFAFFRDTGPKTVPAPDFTLMTVAQAKADAKGFQIVDAPGTAGGKPAGTITAQDPKPTTPVLPGQEIKVTFDPGPPPVGPKPPVRRPRIEAGGVKVGTTLGTRSQRVSCSVKVDPNNPNRRDHRC